MKNPQYTIKVSSQFALVGKDIPIEIARLVHNAKDIRPSFVRDVLKVLKCSATLNTYYLAECIDYHGHTIYAAASTSDVQAKDLLFHIIFYINPSLFTLLMKTV